jgi:RNA polymerase sigma-70 factor (ECF subfamily)
MTFEAFYSKYFDVAWRALSALGVAERDLSDVTQEVFVQVHKKFSAFDGGDGGATWLRAFCVNASRNWRRLGRNRHETHDDERASLVVDLTTKDPERVAAENEGTRLLTQALDVLPPEQREVFVLFELEQVSSPEIARLLGIPLGTCYSRLRLARVAFRAAIENLTHEQPDTRTAQAAR